MEICFLHESRESQLHHCTCHPVKMQMKSSGIRCFVTPADRTKQHRKPCGMWECSDQIVASALAYQLLLNLDVPTLPRNHSSSCHSPVSYRVEENEDA